MSVSSHHHFLLFFFAVSSSSPPFFPFFVYFFVYFFFFFFFFFHSSSLKSIQFYNIWLQSWSKDGSELKELDPYYHRWYLSAMFKIARSYSKIYHNDPHVMNRFIKLSFDAYNKLLMKAKEWNAEHCMEKELELCREMVQLLPYKMDRVAARGSFQV